MERHVERFHEGLAAADSKYEAGLIGSDIVEFLNGGDKAMDGARAAIVVVPSLGEGFGMVALEAMERGRAVVASAVGGLPEIVADGTTGVLVPPADPRALAAALASLLADPDRGAAMGRAGRRRALEAFSQERCTARIDELYREALATA